jgi:hypothetical protein
VLLNTLRRVAQLNDSVLSTVEQGPDVGRSENDDSAASEAEARIIEGDTRSLRAFSVPRSETSGFNAFLDGIQRAQVKLYYGPVPIVYGYGAAVIRARADRRMSTHPHGLLDEREALFLPFRLVSPSELEPFGLTRDRWSTRVRPTSSRCRSSRRRSTRARVRLWSAGANQSSARLPPAGSP